MLASKVYPLTTPLLTLRKDSELGKQQLGQDLSWRYFFTSSIKARWLASSPDERLQFEGKAQQEMHKAKLQGRGHTSQPKWSWLVEAGVQLATDVKSLIQWLNHDILALAGPPWAERQNSLISSSKS